MTTDEDAPTAFAAFLNARLDDDERVATALLTATRLMNKEPDFYGCGGPAAASHFAHFDPARALADVESGRRTIELHSPSPEPGQHPDFCWHDREELPCTTLRLRALPYARHDDYREEWRP